uniref:oxidoreductase n=1 Tax=Proteiniclasticum ruminis TaxID=398199 RepID=UPI003F917753
AGYINPHENTQGYFRDLTGELKKHIHIPVLLTGGITDLHAAETILVNEESDLIGIGRAIYKDSEFLRRELEHFRRE